MRQRRLRGLAIAILVPAVLFSATVAADQDVIIPWLSGEHALASDRHTVPPSQSSQTSAPAAPYLQRPRLSVSLIDPGAGPASIAGRSGSQRSGTGLVLSGNQWRTGTSMEATHIMCQRGTSTGHSYLAEDCRLVSSAATPDHSAHLMHLGGEWMARPNLQFGMGLFRGEAPVLPFSPQAPGDYLPTPLAADFDASVSGFTPLARTEGVDLSVSLELEAGRVGDFLLDLQVARYRDNSQLTVNTGDIWLADFDQRYNHSFRNAAQLSVGWHRGDFSGGISGHYRDQRPGPRLGGADYNQPHSNFDIEFSWRAPWNASFSVGASNVLDQQPAENVPDPVDESGDTIFGRIPYVRYKQDL